MGRSTKNTLSWLPQTQPKKENNNKEGEENCNPGVNRDGLCFDLTGRFVTVIKIKLASSYVNFRSLSYSVLFLLKPYDKKKGVVLDQTGFVVVRAVAKKDNWVTSQVYTSK